MKNGEITRAICAVFNTKMHTYEQLLTKANLPSLYNRILQDIAILMFKVKNNPVPPYIQDLFFNNAATTTYNLRNSDFRIPRFNTVTYGKHSIRYIGPLLWSNISRDVRNVNSLNVFKHAIRNIDFSFLEAGGCRSCHLCNS